MHRRQSLAVLLAGFVVLPAPAVRADVKLHGLFTDNMVLQQGVNCPVWGTAAPGESVEASLGVDGKLLAAAKPVQADKDGRWLIKLPVMKPGGPYTLTVKGKNQLALKNVLVGEVWICSGQSNMARTVTNGGGNVEQVVAGSRNPNIRLFAVPRVGAPMPQPDVKGAWQECGPDTVGNFSAVGYYFGRDLQKALGVPVGLINSSVGGTPAEAWTSRPAMEAVPALKAIVAQDLANYPQAKANFPKLMEQHKAALAKHKEAVARATAAGKPPPQAPRRPEDPDRGTRRPTVLYNAMIAPLTRFPIKGAIWYQGESNADRHDQYEKLLSVMIENWRDAWKQGDFPFLIVQLAPYRAKTTEPADTSWARLREAQRQVALKVPNTGLAVITDVGDEKDIHPTPKEPVGARLALAALATTYGKKIDYSGPAYDGMKVEGSKAVLSFKHIGGGLVAKDGSLTGFTIAGADRKFHNAEAVIEGDRVIVSCKDVAKPVAVRFGWANYPVVNLWNKAGLPASPFRTDDWPLAAAPKKP